MEEKRGEIYRDEAQWPTKIYTSQQTSDYRGKTFGLKKGFLEALRFALDTVWLDIEEEGIVVNEEVAPLGDADTRESRSCVFQMKVCKSDDATCPECKNRRHTVPGAYGS